MGLFSVLSLPLVLWENLILGLFLGKCSVIFTYMLMLSIVLAGHTLILHGYEHVIDDSDT